MNQLKEILSDYVILESDLKVLFPDSGEGKEITIVFFPPEKQLIKGERVIRRLGCNEVLQCLRQQKQPTSM